MSVRFPTQIVNSLKSISARTALGIKRAALTHVEIPRRGETVARMTSDLRSVYKRSSSSVSVSEERPQGRDERVIQEESKQR